MQDTVNTVNPVNDKVFKNYGWICPVCGRGNSPYTATCPCQPVKWNITCGPQWKYTYSTNTGTGGTVNETR